MRNLIAHLVGDYVVQSNWMANAKTTEHTPAVLHGVSYAAAYLPLTRDWRALAVIGGTHAVIDRYRLAKYLVWARNQVAPAEHRYPLADAGPFGQRGHVNASAVLDRVRWMAVDQGHVVGFGYTVQLPEEDLRALREQAERETPLAYDNDWLHGWLLFIADNTMHLLINEWALARWERHT